MSSRVMFKARTWVVAALTALGVTTAVSFVRAQTGPAIPANTVTFGAGGGIPVRGTPLAQRGNGFAYSLPPGPVFFGAWMRPAPNMPSTPVVPRGLGQNPTPIQNNPFGSQSGQQMQGGALGQQGGQQGGIGGQQGGIGGIGGGQGGQQGGQQGGVSGGALGAAVLAAQGQNFQNPTGNLGFVQLPNPQAYIGGFTGGQITGTGVVGGQQAQGQQGQQGIQGGIQGGIGGGFGGGGIGGKGAGFAGANGS